MSKKFNNVLLGTDKKRVFLEDCTVTYTEKIKNKELKYLEEKDQISIVSDALFKTMLCNRENKMFICKILAELLERPFDEIMANSEYYKNELDKDTVHTKGQRADLILKLDDDYIQVEMNNTDAIYRDIEYADKLYRAKILVGKKIYIQEYYP